MQTYEIGYLVLPSIPETELSGVIDAVKGAVEKAGGIYLEGEAPFKYDLAYKMTKTVGASRYVVSDAYMGWLKFELEPAKALEVKVALEKINELLRFLLIKVPKETSFTFAKAQAAIAEKIAQDTSDREEASELAEEVSHASSGVIQ